MPGRVPGVLAAFASHDDQKGDRFIYGENKSVPFSPSGAICVTTMSRERSLKSNPRTEVAGGDRLQTYVEY